MSNKAMILCYKWQKLDDSLKGKIEAAIKSAIENYGVTNFYFGNELECYDEEENAALESMFVGSNSAHEFVAEKIREYKKKNNTNITTALIAARVNDKNFNESLFDEIIQGYTIYCNEVDCEDSTDAFILRDNFLANNIDYIFWCSNKILQDQSQIARTARLCEKTIINIG